MKICLYAHNWHYIDLYQPLIDEFETRGIPYDVVIFYPRTETAARHVTRKDVIELSQWPSIRSMEAACSKVPFIGETLFAIFMSRVARRLIIGNAYTVIVTTDDRALFFPPLLLRSAARLGIPTILYPIETLETPEGNYDAKASGAPKAPTLVKRLARAVVSHWYPKSVASYHGASVYFFATSRVLPFLIFRFLSVDPWLRGMHQDLAKVAVNSRLQFDINATYGMSPKKLVLTGSPIHDTVARALVDGARRKTVLLRRIGAGSHKKLFLVIGTHLRGVYTPAAAKRITAEFQRVFDTLSTHIPNSYEIVCKVHPNLELGEQAAMMSELAIRRIRLVKNECGTYELIAAADCIMTFGSSAIVAALATRVPVLAYRAKDFSSSFDEMHGALRSVRLLYDADYLMRTLDDLQRGSIRVDLDARMTDTERFGVFDGRNTTRMMQLIEDVARVTAS